MTASLSTDDLPAAARRVQAALDGFAMGLKVVRFTESTRTSEEAAAAIGCPVERIAKSLIFRGKTSGAPVLVIASGANRVDEKRVAAVIGEKVGRADADFVREATGFAIGGVPPLAHAAPPGAPPDTPPGVVLIDADVMTFPEVWAAAGTPNTVFRMTPEQLVIVSGGTIADIRKE